MKRVNVRFVAFSLVLICVLLRWPQFYPGHTYVHGIADERSVYPPGTVAKAQAEGELLKQYLGDLPVTVGFVGTWAMHMYYAEFPVAIECHTGLTDEHIAHLPVDERGRPGHEKPAPMDYLQRRGVNFLFTAGPGEAEAQHLRFISFDDIPAAIIVYDNDVMEPLAKQEGVDFIEFPTFLDESTDEIASFPPERRREFLAFSKEFYFDHNDDPERLSALLAIVEGDQ
jgi:hypothetical protein